MNKPTRFGYKTVAYARQICEISHICARRPVFTFCGPPAAALSRPDAENASMRAYRHDLAPGASSAEHTHARPYLLIAATDVELQMRAPDGREMAHAVKAGDMHWVDQAVTHTLANRGSQNAILVEIEIK